MIDFFNTTHLSEFPGYLIIGLLWVTAFLFLTYIVIRLIYNVIGITTKRTVLSDDELLRTVHRAMDYAVQEHIKREEEALKKYKAQEKTILDKFDAAVKLHQRHGEGGFVPTKDVIDAVTKVKTAKPNGAPAAPSTVINK